MLSIYFTSFRFYTKERSITSTIYYNGLPKVFPPSVLPLKNTFLVQVLLYHHVIYTLSPYALIGAKILEQAFSAPVNYRIYVLYRSQ